MNTHVETVFKVIGNDVQNSSFLTWLAQNSLASTDTRGVHQWPLAHTTGSDEQFYPLVSQPDSTEAVLYAQMLEQTTRFFIKGIEQNSTIIMCFMMDCLNLNVSITVKHVLIQIVLHANIFTSSIKITINQSIDHALMSD